MVVTGAKRPRRRAGGDVPPASKLVNGAAASAATPGVTSGIGEWLYLAGRPSLRRFLRHVRNHALSPPDRGELIETWKAAREQIRVLERDEAGLADGPGLTPLGPEYRPLLAEFLGSPIARRSFNTVPCDIALVELDRLVVYQKHIDVTYARQLAEKIGPAPDAERVFRVCLPHEPSTPPVSWSEVHRHTYVFVTPSNDLRFLGTAALRPEQLPGVALRGNPAGVLGLTVGFGSNLLNAVFVENRLILNNGSHRAFALRELGVTHVPCIVQHLSSRDELEVAGSAKVRKEPALYLEHPRPAMFRDYFAPALRTVIPSRRRLRQVTVRFEVDEVSIPAP